MDGQRPHWRGLPSAFWYLWVGMLISRLGGFVFTFLAVYLKQRRGFSVEATGLVVSLYGAGSLTAGPLGGILADRIGRRPTLILGLLGASAAMVNLGLSHGYGRIALGAALLGCLSDLGRPAITAAIADMVPPDSRVRAYGLIYWAINLGFAGAAMLAGLLAKVDYLLLFVVDATMTGLFGLIILLRFPETRPPPSAASATDVRTAEPAVSLLQPYRDGVFVTFILIHFTVSWVFCQSIASLPLDMSSHGISVARFGQLIAINGVLIVILQPLVLRYVSRVQRRSVLALGALLNGIGFGLPALGHTQWLYAASIVLWTLGEILLSPVVLTLIADLAPPRLRGSYQGGYQLSWGTASLLGPSLGGLIMGRLGAPVLWLICLLVGGLGALLHLLTAPARRRRLRTLPDAESLLLREDGR